jgi:hypothetical protein
MSDFQIGMLFGCGLSMLIGFIWMWICQNLIPQRKQYPKERDPADWWKDT